MILSFNDVGGTARTGWPSANTETDTNDRFIRSALVAGRPTMRAVALGDAVGPGDAIAVAGDVGFGDGDIAAAALAGGMDSKAVSVGAVV